MKAIAQAITAIILVAVWLALAIVAGLIGSAVIGCQWLADRVRK